VNFIRKSNGIPFNQSFDGITKIPSHKTNESIVKTFDDGLSFFEDEVQIETSTDSKDKQTYKCVESLGHFFPKKGVNIFQNSKVIYNLDESHDS
jgi:hypothetical protein